MGKLMAKTPGIFDRVRFLEGRLDRLEVVILKQDETIRLLREAVGLEPPKKYVETSMRKIAEIVADIAHDNGLTLDEIKRKTMARAISWPRQYAFSVLLDAGFSSPAVARFFSVDHTTVLFGAEKARGRLESESPAG